MIISTKIWKSCNYRGFILLFVHPASFKVQDSKLGSTPISLLKYSGTQRNFLRFFMCATNVCVVKCLFLLCMLQNFHGYCADLLYLSNDSFERSRIVYCEVSEDLTIDFDTSLVERAHELRV